MTLLYCISQNNKEVDILFCILIIPMEFFKKILSGTLDIMTLHINAQG